MPHTKGVIHRDIKPSNVLVTVADGRPIPKVIDFGIAKATGVRLTDKTFFTEHRALIGTPEYMSPEHAEMSSVDIDTRSDVYSLGVLLYVLLTGTTPFASETLRAVPPGEMQRIIRENDPPRPSTRLSTMGENLVDVAARRQTEPHKLRKMVRGDLDWIVMKAMEKDRTRRYETASGLAEDVQRHLRGEAVLAAPPSAAYRLRKFARRNRAGVLVGSIVAFALVLGMIGTSIGLAWALREKDRADEAAARARLAAEQESTAKQQAQAEALRAKTAEEAAEARAAELAQVARFQSSMLSDIDVALMGDRLREDVLAEADLQLSRLNLPPTDIEARRTTFEQAIAGLNFTNPALASLERNVLQRALSAIDEQFADQPLVQARLLHTIADVLQSLGRLDSALQPLERAVEIRRRTLGADHVDTLDSIGNLATIFDDAGDRERAGSLYQEALEGYRRTLGDEHPQTLTAMSNYGYWLDMQGRAEEAERMHRTVLEARRRVLGPEHEHTLISAVNLGVLLRTQGRLDEAEPLYREALEGYRKTLGNEHPWTLAAMNNMAFLLAAKGEVEQAERLHREALATRRRVLGDNHPHTQQSVYSLGKLLRSNKRLAEAEPLYREGLQASRSTLGDDDPETLIDMRRLASLLGEQDKFTEAETLHREAIERSARVHGPAHVETLAARAEFCAVRLTALLRDVTLADSQRHTALQEIESLLLEGI